ncbi:MAG: site-2 protease family protein [Oscillospiraceae bacterium]
MISFEIKKVKLSVSFSFFAVLGLICIIQGSSSYRLLVILISCILHELGHVIMMCLFSVPPESIVAYGGGIKIIPDKSKLVSDCQDILILSAGCIINFFAVFISLAFNREITYFASANLFLGLFNLMPVKYFDGGRILSLALNDSKYVKIIRFCFIGMFGIVIAVMVFNGFFSISLIVTFLYILFSEIFA